MRLYKANNLHEYIEQLEKDVLELKKLQARVELGDFSNLNIAAADRDTCENHSHIISVHYDQLRQARNKQNG